jgi:hypothetical protein
MSGVNLGDPSRVPEQRVGPPLPVGTPSGAKPPTPPPTQKDGAQQLSPIPGAAGAVPEQGDPPSPRPSVALKASGIKVHEEAITKIRAKIAPKGKLIEWRPLIHTTKQECKEAFAAIRASCNTDNFSDLMELHQMLLKKSVGRRAFKEDRVAAQKFIKDQLPELGAELKETSDPLAKRIQEMDFELYALNDIQGEDAAAAYLEEQLKKFDQEKATVSQCAKALREIKLLSKYKPTADYTKLRNDIFATRQGKRAFEKQAAFSIAFIKKNFKEENFPDTNLTGLFELETHALKKLQGDDAENAYLKEILSGLDTKVIDNQGKIKHTHDKSDEYAFSYTMAFRAFPILAKRQQLQYSPMHQVHSVGERNIFHLRDILFEKKKGKAAYQAIKGKVEDLKTIFKLETLTLHRSADTIDKHLNTVFAELTKAIENQPLDAKIQAYKDLKPTIDEDNTLDHGAKEVLKGKADEKLTQLTEPKAYFEEILIEADQNIEVKKNYDNYSKEQDPALQLEKYVAYMDKLSEVLTTKMDTLEENMRTDFNRNMDVHFSALKTAIQSSSSAQALLNKYAEYSQKDNLSLDECQDAMRVYSLLKAVGVECDPKGAVGAANQILNDLDNKILDDKRVVKQGTKTPEEDYKRALKAIDFLIENGNATYTNTRQVIDADTASAPAENTSFFSRKSPATTPKTKEVKVDRSVFELRKKMLTKKPAKKVYEAQLKKSKQRIGQQFPQAVKVLKDKATSLNDIIFCEEIAMRKQLAELLWGPDNVMTANVQNDEPQKIERNLATFKKLKEELKTTEESFQKQTEFNLKKFLFQKKDDDLFGHLAEGNQISQLEAIVFRSVYQEIINVSKEYVALMTKNPDDIATYTSSDHIKKCIKAQYLAIQIYERIAPLNTSRLEQVYTADVTKSTNPATHQVSSLAILPTLAPAFQRTMRYKDLIVGLSTHSPDQTKKALETNATMIKTNIALLNAAK